MVGQHIDDGQAVLASRRAVLIIPLFFSGFDS
jgi:hypothetical protein